MDVVIVGAGIVGASVAYWLTRLDPSLSILLIERDRSFAKASSSLSASSIRQRFSSAVNIRMSQFGVQFLREFGIPLTEGGYLYLGAARPLEELHEIQKANGAAVALLPPDELKKRFPWLTVDDIELGSLGLSGEGWFDGPALHAAVLRRALRLADGSKVECRHAVNATGPWARTLAAAAGIDLPVHARRRTVFVLSCPDSLPGCPLVIDPSPTSTVRGCGSR